MKCGPLPDRQQSWHDDRTGMNRAPFVGVVKIFTMGGDAVDKSSGFDPVTLRKTEHSARTGLLHCRQCSQYIVFMACRHANAGHIHQQTPCHGQRQGI